MGNSFFGEQLVRCCSYIFLFTCDFENSDRTTGGASVFPEVSTWPPSWIRFRFRFPLLFCFEDFGAAGGDWMVVSASRVSGGAEVKAKYCLYDK